MELGATRVEVFPDDRLTVGGEAITPPLPYSLMRHLAAVVAFPLALAGIAEVIRVRCRTHKI